jgi:hypothetical protein
MLRQNSISFSFQTQRQNFPFELSAKLVKSAVKNGAVTVFCFNKGAASNSKLQTDGKFTSREIIASTLTPRFLAKASARVKIRI